LDLNFDGEILTDFTTLQDQIVLNILDSSDMLQNVTAPTGGVMIAGQSYAAGTVIPFITISADNSTVSNTTVASTTTITGSVTAPVYTTVKTPVYLNSATADADSNPEVSIIMELGSDNAIGTVVNVTSDQRTGVTPSATSAADFRTVDEILTLEPNAQPVAGDFLLKVQQSAGTGAIEYFNVKAQTIGGTATPGLTEVDAQVVYTAANQSQAGSNDKLVNFDWFNDQLDFTGLGLAQYAKDYDIVKDGIQIDEILKVVVGISDPSGSSLNNGFAPDQVQNPDAYAAKQANAANGNVLFVLQVGVTASATVGQVTQTGNYLLFVDANHDGVYNSATDMMIDFINEVNANTSTSNIPAAIINSLVGTPGSWTPSTSVPAVNIIGSQVTTDPTAAHAVDSTFMI
jgi:hypothetical protein